MSDDCFSNLLVTGGCGFIPSNFINYILEQVQPNSVGRVINYDLLMLDSNKTNVKSSHLTSQRYVLVVGDISNRELLDQTLHRYNIEAIVHFAALTHVCHSFKEPLEFVRTNVEGTVTLLESCRSYGRLK